VVQRAEEPHVAPFQPPAAMPGFLFGMALWMCLLRPVAEPKTRRDGAAPEPEAPPPGGDQRFQRLALVLRRRLYGGAQAGDALIRLTELDQAETEVHPGAVVGFARQNSPEALGRVAEITLILQGYPESEQGVYVVRQNREHAGKSGLRVRRVGAIELNASECQGQFK
jgi:hypothetical protein